VHDVIDTTAAALRESAPADADAVRLASPLVAFSAPMRERSDALKHFLLRNLYRHPQVMQTTAQARQVVQALVEAYRAQPSEMPPAYAQQADLARAIADYIAGMTDRFAAREHTRLTGLKLLDA
jgi:dGTPase